MKINKEVLINIFNTLNLNLDFLKMEIVNYINIYNFWNDISEEEEKLIDQQLKKLNDLFLNYKSCLVDFLNLVKVDNDKLTEFIKTNKETINKVNANKNKNIGELQSNVKKED